MIQKDNQTETPQNLVKSRNFPETVRNSHAA